MTEKPKPTPTVFLTWKDGKGCPICGMVFELVNTAALEHFLGHIWDQEECDVQAG